MPFSLVFSMPFLFTEGSKSVDVGYSTIFLTDLYEPSLKRWAFSWQNLYPLSVTFFSVPTLDWWLAVLSLPWSLDHFLLVIKIQNWLSLIFNRYKSIKLCWVPCYVSVASNDHAYCWGGGIPPPNVPVPFPRNGFLPCHSQMDPHYWRDKGLCITGY